MNDLILTVCIILLTGIAIYAGRKLQECEERMRMCEAFARAFRRCPSEHIDGACWLSEAWRSEMKQLGVDLEAKP